MGVKERIIGLKLIEREAKHKDLYEKIGLTVTVKEKIVEKKNK